MDDEKAYRKDILADRGGEEEDERYKTEVDITRLEPGEAKSSG